MNFTPKVHHELIIRHLEENPRAALFAEMGFGKTACTLQALTTHFGSGAVRGALIVAPMLVANMTWPQEIEKWEDFRWMKIGNLRTKEGWEMLERGHGDIYTINYESLPRLCDQYLSKVRKPAFNAIVFDELTKCKNPQSVRMRQLRRYLAKMEYRWGLTGTPTPNSLLELFGQFLMLDGGERLGDSFFRFRQEHFFATDYMEYNWAPKPGAKEKIYQKIQDITLTMRSSEWLGLPDTETETIEVSLPTDVRAIYKGVEKDLFTKLDQEETISVVTAAALSNKLIQICSGMVYLDSDTGEKNWRKLHDGKLDALESVVKRDLGPMLVGCNYRHEQAAILERFPQARGLINTPKSEHTELFRQWNAGEIPMLVADGRSVSHGLNLQFGGNVVVWFSLPWAPDTYDQMVCRLARPGQKEAVKVFRILVRDSIDEVVLGVLEKKDEAQVDLLTTLRKYRESR